MVSLLFTNITGFILHSPKEKAQRSVPNIAIVCFYIFFHFRYVIFREAFLETRQCVVARLKIQRENQQQEQLLLWVHRQCSNITSRFSGGGGGVTLSIRIVFPYKKCDRVEPTSICRDVLFERIDIKVDNLKGFVLKINFLVFSLDPFYQGEFSCSGLVENFIWNHEIFFK